MMTPLPTLCLVWNANRFWRPLHRESSWMESLVQIKILTISPAGLSRRRRPQSEEDSRGSAPTNLHHCGNHKARAKTPTSRCIGQLQSDHHVLSNDSPYQRHRYNHCNSRHHALASTLQQAYNYHRGRKATHMVDTF